MAVGERTVPRPWDEAYRTQGRLWRGARLDPLTRSFLDERPEARAWRWLDAGCGDGKGMLPMARLVGTKMVGADRSVWGLRLARDAFREAGLARQSMVRADARAWPFRAGAFDAVRAMHFIGHLREEGRVQAVGALRDLLRPGGVLLLSEFGTGDFRRGQGDEVEPQTFRRGVGILTHYFEKDELESLLTSHGFEVGRIEAQRFFVDYGGAKRPRERWDVVALRRQPSL